MLQVRVLPPEPPNPLLAASFPLVNRIPGAHPGVKLLDHQLDLRRRGYSAGFNGRIVHDTLVHRWDAEAGAGIAGPAMEPDIAADAADEVLDVGLRVTQAVADSPAGPAIRLACTDATRRGTSTSPGSAASRSTPSRSTST
jgi:hypothetical protein